MFQNLNWVFKVNQYKLFLKVHEYKTGGKQKYATQRLQSYIFTPFQPNSTRNSQHCGWDQVLDFTMDNLMDNGLRQGTDLAPERGS